MAYGDAALDEKGLNEIQAHITDLESALKETAKVRDICFGQVKRCKTQIDDMVKLAEEALECACASDSRDEHTVPILEKIVAIGKGES